MPDGSRGLGGGYSGRSRLKHEGGDQTMNGRGIVEGRSTKSKEVLHRVRLWTSKSLQTWVVQTSAVFGTLSQNTSSLMSPRSVWSFEDQSATSLAMLITNCIASRSFPIAHRVHPQRRMRRDIKRKPPCRYFRSFPSIL